MPRHDQYCDVGGTVGSKATATVINELLNRGIIDEEAYDELFGCKSFDEVAREVDNVIKRRKK